MRARCSAGAWRRQDLASSSRSGGGPADLDAVVRVVGHLESLGARDDVGEAELLDLVVAPRVRKPSRGELPVTSLAHPPHRRLDARRALAESLGASPHDVHKARHGVHRDQQTHVARRGGEVFPRAGGREDRSVLRHLHGAPGILGDPSLAVVHAHHPPRDRFGERVDERELDVDRVERARVDQALHALVEVVGAPLVLLHRERDIARPLGDLPVLQRRIRLVAAVVEHRPPRLEAGADVRGVGMEQKRAAPESTTPHRAVGLGVRADEDPVVVVHALRDPARDHQQVSVRVGEHRARPQRLAR